MLLLLRSCNIFPGETSMSIQASWLSIQSSICGLQIRGGQKEKAGESGYLQLSGRLSTDRHRRIDRAHQDGQPERAGICLNPTCKKEAGQTFPFRAQQGQVLQGGEKDFPENAPVRGIAKVYLLSG